MPDEASTNVEQTVAWYRRIGPGLITACVVIGPGSILVSSTIGANKGYTMLWVVVVSVIFMLVYMTMSAKLGAVSSVSPGDVVRRKAGRPLAILLGCIVFIIAAAFQSGNNIGVAAAFEAFIDSKPIVAALVVVFNAIAIMFLFLFKNLYRMMERLMMFFVAMMLVSFAVNLFTLKPDPVAMAKGLIPTTSTIDIELLGLIGTTFVISGAFYQAYLVQQKGWDAKQVRSGIIDARVGAVIMALITIILMSTAAAGLYTGSPVTLADPVAVAEALEPTFGKSGKIIFCVGIFCAAYSSFLINSMTGGFIVSDGFGLGSGARDRWPRIMTTLGLLTGMVVALAALVLNFDRTPTIIAAQAVTVVGAPLVAGVLLWLASSKDVMGEHVNGPVTKVFAGIGLIVLLAMAANTAFVTLPAKIQQYRESAPDTISPSEAIPAVATAAAWEI
ncbi:Nramp family divalent metal transporter [Aureliella helgolandensis]|uniref:Divalent metal cation transporter MntH n=1 Tax=Aureliella helgolandensis TaxID=2527968 RepID=A0A518GDZ3_9BACT|nr:Nramp family divalent metal transporter [Aureliella helgolandensis]QDV26780.1 Divalent metal cation transporter MntH [Aureliella helgolandensis]